MSHSFTNFLSHCIWSTKHRHPFITKEIKPRLNSYIRAVIQKEGAHLLFINGIEDHIHLLIATPSTILVPNLIEKLKPITTK
jgi:putative transposase